MLTYEQALGLAACFIFPLVSDSECCVIWPPTGRPINTVIMDEILDSASIDVMFVAPSLLEDIVQSPNSFAKLGNVKTIVTGGGKYNILPCNEIPLADNVVAQVLYPEMLETHSLKRLGW